MVNHRETLAKFPFNQERSNQSEVTSKVIISLDLELCSSKLAHGFKGFSCYISLMVAAGSAAHMWLKYEFYVMDSLDKLKQARIKWYKLVNSSMFGFRVLCSCWYCTWYCSYDGIS